MTTGGRRHFHGARFETRGTTGVFLRFGTFEAVVLAMGGADDADRVYLARLFFLLVVHVVVVVVVGVAFLEHLLRVHLTKRVCWWSTTTSNFYKMDKQHKLHTKHVIFVPLVDRTLDMVVGGV